MMPQYPPTKTKVTLSYIVLKLQIHNYTDKYHNTLKRLFHNIVSNDQINITCHRRKDNLNVNFASAFQTTSYKF